MKPLFFLLSILASYTVALSALAQVEESPEREQAKAYFGQAIDAYNETRFEEAAQLFVKAQELNPSWKLHFNIGQCYGALKKYGKALDEFEAYLAKGGDDVTTDRREEVLKEMKQFKQMVGILSIKGPKGASVSVDNENRGTLPLKGLLRVSSGVDHHLKVVLDAQVLYDDELRLGSEEIRDIEVTPAQEDPPAVPVAVPTEGSVDQAKDEPVGEDAEEAPVTADEELAPATKPIDKRRKIIGWTLVGVGGAALGVGAITGGMALAKNNELDEGCQTGECLPEYHKRLERRDALAVTSTIMFGVGAAAAVAGVLVLTIKKKEHSTAKRKRHIQVVPVADNGSVGALVWGRF